MVSAGKRGLALYHRLGAGLFTAVSPQKVKTFAELYRVRLWRIPSCSVIVIARSTAIPQKFVSAKQILTLDCLRIAACHHFGSASTNAGLTSCLMLAAW